jgi:hypothetical protein
MHTPWSQKVPCSLQALKHFPQCSSSCSVLTQAPSQISSPGPMQSPPVLVCVVPVLVPPVVPLVWLVDDESLPDEVDVPSVVVVVVVVDVDVDDVPEVDDDDDDVPEDVGVAVVDDVISEVDEVDMVFVLDIESDPTEAVIVPLVVAAVVCPSRSSPLQAKRVKPTSAAITTGAAPWTWHSAAEQNGQRESLSQT